MMKKYIVIILGAAFVFLTGCGRDDSKEAQNSAVGEFPANYNVSMENVSFDCVLELPEDFHGMSVPEMRMNAKIYPDTEAVYEHFVKGKDIVRQDSHQNGDYPEIEVASYYFPDGSHVGRGTYFLYSTEESTDYGRCAGALSYDAEEYYADCSITSVSMDKCMEAVRKMMDEAGYPETEWTFSACALSKEYMERRQQGFVQEGRLEESRTRVWTNNDEGWLLWAVQSYEGIPVFSEDRNRGSELAKECASNAQLTAICSSEGVKHLFADTIYDLESTGRTLILKNFDDIAKTVADKYNNIITEQPYEVKRAKLFHRIYLDKKQNYAVQPAWYFEVSQEGSKSHVMMVDAVNGEEIVLDAFM